MRSVLLAAVTLCYPVAVYLLLKEHGVRALVLPLCALAVLRMALRREWLWGVLLLVMAAATLLTDRSLPAKFYPVAVNLGLLGVFGHSLLKPPSFVERIARLREPLLPAAAVAYTRHVTMVWCAFFVFNAAIAAWLAVFGSDAAWALYSGGIAYLCAALLFGIEFLARQYLRRKWNHD
ncbi:MAG: hypothetical protein QM696_02010 [Steroidobacteraceae bacterium]